MTDSLATRIANIRGANYVPSNAVNDTQFWEEFDLTTIDRELGYAEGLGLNSVRVFLQYLVYEADPKGMIERFEAFLSCADKHGLSVIPVLFDDCFRPEPQLGPQPTPVANMHNSQWQSSPGRSRMTQAYRPKLRRYVDDFLTTFKHDPRIIAWDLYNEAQVRSYSVLLVKDVFEWARAIAPDQPLTSCYYGALLSDITNIHPYISPTNEPDEFARVIEGAKAFGKPIAATEILGRPNHGELHEVLPILRENQIGWYFWELMIGVNQTCFQWPNAPAAPADVFFQGVLYPDGTPYRQDEADLLRSYAQVSVP
ncbi:MAG: 1,4-beta-xylanase [Anaerolineae bacterium]|nr:1,4-beta-xylanase [Anaerolineae bacterium]